jgi:hypothetical protein
LSSRGPQIINTALLQNLLRYQLPITSGMPASIGQLDMAGNNASHSHANQPLYRLIDDMVRSAGEPAILGQMISK